MDMKGERHIPAPRQTVWDALNDPDVLKACIPGCESLEKTGENELRATAAVKIGPIAARFNGRVQLTDLDPPNGYHIGGEGQGGVAGFAKGGADVHLADDGAGTRLTYDVKAQVGGKIAQLGARLIDATSKQMADMFFDRFTALVGAPLEAAVQTGMQQTGMQQTGMQETDVPRIATIDPALPGEPLPISPRLMPPPPSGAVSMLSMIPSELFGLPIIAIVGIVLWLIIFVMIFKSYVFG